MDLSNYRTNKKPPLNVMKYIQAYLIFTLVFYFIGPVQWKTQNTFIMVTFVLIYQLCFYFGYFFLIKRPNRLPAHKICESQYVVKYFWIFSIITIVLNLLIFVRITILYGLDSLIETIILSVTNPTALYYAETSAQLSENMFGGQLLALINAFASPITFALIPVGMLLFKKLPLLSKVLFIAAGITNILLSLSAGRAEGLMVIAVYIISWVLLRRGNSTVKKSKGYSRVILIVGIIIVFLYAYSALMQNRTLGSYSLPIGTNQIDFENTLFSITPAGMKDLLVYLHIYLTQGYFGMSISLSAPWKPTFFLGFSSWLRNEVEGVLGLDIKSRTLMAQPNIFGWKYGVNWHTAYTWFACDLWWLFVPIIMFLFGCLLAAVYKDAYNTKNPVAIALFALLLLFVIYLPANNYLFSDSDTFISFFVYLFLWGVRFDRRRNHMETERIM